MKPATFSDPDRNDLDWQAFLYVCDEMPGDSRAQFELLLAESQPAREALARAVEICQAVSLAQGLEQPQPATVRGVRRQGATRRLQWMASGAAVALALVLLVGGSLHPLWLGGGGPEAGPAEVASLNTELGQLAEIWGASREQVAAAAMSALEIEADEWASDADIWIDQIALPQDAGDGAAAAAFAAEEESAVEAPPWMIAALEGLLQNDMSEVDREVQEN